MEFGMLFLAMHSLALASLKNSTWSSAGWLNCWIICCASFMHSLVCSVRIVKSSSVDQYTRKNLKRKCFSIRGRGKPQ